MYRAVPIGNFHVKTIEEVLKLLYYDINSRQALNFKSNLAVDGFDSVNLGSIYNDKKDLIALCRKVNGGFELKVKWDTTT